MKRNPTEELFTPFKNKKQEDSKEEVVGTMTETMEEYMYKTRGYYGLGVTGYELCKGPHYTKECPLKEEGKTLEEAYYTQFGVPFQQGGKYRAVVLGFYQRNNINSSCQERRQSMEESLSKFMNKLEKRLEENFNMIKEIQASTDTTIRIQETSIKTLEIQIGKMSKPLELRRNHVDDLEPVVKECEVVNEPMMDIVTARCDFIRGLDDYPSDCDFDRKIHIDCAYNLTFSCMIASCMEARRFDGIITIRDGDDSVTYEMMWSNMRFKHLTSEKCNNILPLLKDSMCLGLRTMSRLSLKNDMSFRDNINNESVLPNDTTYSLKSIRHTGLQQIHTAYSNQLNTAYRSSDTVAELNLIFVFNFRTFRMKRNYRNYDENNGAIHEQDPWESGVARPKINDKTHFKLKGQFLKELHKNTFRGSEHEDANEHIKKVLKIIALFLIPEVTQDQIMLRAFPMSLTRVMSRWLKIDYKLGNPENKVSKQEVILFYNGLDVPTRQLLDSKGAIPTKIIADAKFEAPYQPRGQYRAAGPEFYQCNNGNSSYPDRRQTLEESLTKFMAELANRHEENSNIIKEIRASIDAAIRNQRASIKTLEIQIGQMNKVLQEKGIESFPGSIEPNPMDHVKSISTAKANSFVIRRIELGPYTEAREVRIIEIYDHTLPQKEKDPGIFTLPFIYNICFDKALVDLGSSVSVMPFYTYSNLGLDKGDYEGKNLAGTLIDIPIFVETFSIILGFSITDDMDITSRVVLGMPFCKMFVSCQRL
uniref:Reverse transcriptase domain-containing protein n=1 Tax=Tanacetum cinerariifolium TaxID=118510 RepID=A0A699GUE0_TANCI|nr:hypothetical protein [Tanacetum cinerariifolium]